MSVRCVGFIRPPESSAGHFDHFDVVGLEPFVDRADANHARRCDRQLLGEGPGTSSCDERYQDQASPKFGTDAVDFTHPILRILAVASTICLAERLQSDLSRWTPCRANPRRRRKLGQTDRTDGRQGLLKSACEAHPLSRALRLARPAPGGKTTG